ncbi:hypothetical protein G6L37_04545 [Agrobacterium rubi]|nr:hypothetical protein [Agrobacterium rubi]NTF24622.1 hypothetical protein [Agrobacterium rubi]
METFRDHPLSFLCSRPSPRGLRRRASDWREKKYDALGMDVPGIFDRAASNIEDIRSLLGEALAMTRSAAPLADLGKALRLIEVDSDVADMALETAQIMRERQLDPYGGSVCASLEMAHEELTLVGHLLERVIAMSDADRPYGDVEAVILEAGDMLVVPTATHEAPRGVM